MATPTTTNLPTRQQLDEIDALLRRMLTLPSLAGAAAEPALAPAAPSSMTFPPPTIREVPPPQPPAPGDPVVQAWRVGWPQPPAPQPPVVPSSVAAWGSPVPPPMESAPWAAVPAAAPHLPYAAPVSPVPMASPVPSPPVQGQAAPRPSESLFILTMIVLNGAFNVLTYLLGPIGSWIRGPGRGLMGWVGILMILAAGVWALGNWYGYDWPRPNLSRFGIAR